MHSQNSPTSWLSKGRMPSTRREASRTVANASGSSSFNASESLQHNKKAHAEHMDEEVRNNGSRLCSAVRLVLPPYCRCCCRLYADSDYLWFCPALHQPGLSLWHRVITKDTPVTCPAPQVTALAPVRAASQYVPEPQRLLCQLAVTSS
jgi:hypothetical protein